MGGTRCGRFGFRVSSCKPLNSEPTDNHRGGHYAMSGILPLPVELLAVVDIVRYIPETEMEGRYALVFSPFLLLQREANISMWNGEFTR